MTLEPSDDVLDRLCGIVRSPDPDPRPALPSLGRYELRELLGEGAVGVVYRAIDRELGRPVAVKILKEPLGSGTAVELRFQREAQVAAALSHPNLVAVHDAGEADGRPYLVMELVEGRPFGRLMRDAPGDRVRLVRILEKVSRGVEAAHARGVVHRDLKPANILVTAEDEPKVGDFGVARLADSEAGLTKTGSVLGTPLYMAPEQVQGRTREITPRTDVYALGAILYEILTGRTPHTGESVTEIYGKIVRDEPSPPARVNPGVPLDLETIAMKALEKDPARRYGSAAEFGEDLRRHLAGEPILARPPGPAEQALKWLRRRKAGAAVAALLVVVVASIAGFARLESRAKAEQRALGLLETARPAIDQAAMALYREDVDIQELFRKVDEARGRIEEAVAAAPRLAAGHLLLSRAWDLLGWSDRAEEAARRATALDPASGPAHHQLARILYQRTFVLLTARTDADRRARQVEAEAVAREAAMEMDLALASPAGFDPAMERSVAKAMRAYAAGDSSVIRGIAEEGARDFEGRPGVEEFHFLAGLVATTIEGKLASLSEAIRRRPHYALAYYVRGTWKVNAGDPAGALADLDRAILLQPRFAAAYSNRGGIRGAMGDRDGAIADLDFAIQLDPRFPMAFVSRGTARQQRGEAELAMADYEQALRLDPRCAIAYSQRAAIRAEAGRPDEALEDCRRAIAEAPGLASPYAVRSGILMGKGEIDAAEADARRAIELDPGNEMAWLHLGGVKIVRGDPKGAVADFAEAIRLDPLLANGWFNRGAALYLVGSADLAEADLRKALSLARPGWPQKQKAEQLVRELVKRRGGDH